MTRPAQRLVPTDRTIVGDPESVGRVLLHKHQQGTLIGVMGRLRRHHDGRVSVPVRMLEPADPVPRRSRRRMYLVTAGVVVTLALVAAAGWALAVAVSWVAGHLGHILGVAVIAGLVLMGVAKVSRAVRRHCPGCPK